jgi:hypothetical protein
LHFPDESSFARNVLLEYTASLTVDDYILPCTRRPDALDLTRLEHSPPQTLVGKLERHAHTNTRTWQSQALPSTTRRRIAAPRTCVGRRSARKNKQQKTLTHRTHAPATAQTLHPEGKMPLWHPVHTYLDIALRRPSTNAPTSPDRRHRRTPHTHTRVLPCNLQSQLHSPRRSCALTAQAASWERHAHTNARIRPLPALPSATCSRVSVPPTCIGRRSARQSKKPHRLTHRTHAHP